MSQERWLTVREGKLFMITENDGWTYMRHGPQEHAVELSLESIRSSYGETRYQEALKLLGAAHVEKMA